MSAFTSGDERAAREGTGIADPAGGLEAPSDAIVHPAREEIELASVLHALSDPVRLQIVGALADGGEVNCKSLGLPVSKSTCTHHFRVLREAGVIRQRVVGTTRLNSLRRDELEWHFPGLLEAVLGAAASAPSL